MTWYYDKPRVTAADRRAKAAASRARHTASGKALEPVTIVGRDIAKSFWGRAWCEHLAADRFDWSRLERGRTYARSGSVIDLKITAGCVTARVVGSKEYKVEVNIEPLAPDRWAAIRADCAGQIDSVVDLLMGRLSDGVMGVVTRPGAGLLPPAAAAGFFAP